MGAHIIIQAAKKLEQKNISVDTLVLVSSAAYPDRSEDAAFGDAFKQAITGAHELPKSAFGVFDYLRAFSGKVVFVWVEHDSTESGGPIYPQMIGWYNDTYQDRKAAGCNDAFMEVHGAEHSFKVGGKTIDESADSLAVYRDFCKQLARNVT